uniref:Uncharacterized protein n=1 Tax=Meloidogyne enterolobii TaxID=390850 RepID=A0A6V7YEM1_MELEN|nr:unnamed protein product [Meloidogyne enterolobii]
MTKYLEFIPSLRFHKSLQKTPYEAVFGRKLHSLPSSVSIDDQIEEFVINGFYVEQTENNKEEIPEEIPICSDSQFEEQEEEINKYCKCNSECKGNRCCCKKEGRFCGIMPQKPFLFK